MDEQVVAVIRMEDASVSHDSLLAANGHRGISHPPPHSPFTRPLALAGVASYHQADQPAATCGLAPRPESAKAARDFTRLRLRDWRMARLSDVAELVVSELVTNACMVTDPNTAGPVRINSHMGAEGGRGLQVVESCSVRWGWRPLDRPLGEDGPAKPGPARSAGSGGAGKVVWALLQLQNLRRIAGGLSNGGSPAR